MFEPLTLGVAELGNRWKLTPRQVLEHAQILVVPLYFKFDGLAFDVDNRWHQKHGDAAKRRKYDSLGNSIKKAAAELKQRVSSPNYPPLTPDHLRKLLLYIQADQHEQNQLISDLEQRETERNQSAVYGLMRAPPDTLNDIDLLGFSPFPNMAFRPGSHIEIVTSRDKEGRDRGFWSGRMLALEPLPRHGSFRKDRLTVDDLCASLAEVKAIEAINNATVVPQKSAPWWQTQYDILEMAQTIGESLHSQRNSTSNSAIAKAISNRIRNIDRSLGKTRPPPDWDTVRGVLTGWKFKSD